MAKASVIVRAKNEEALIGRALEMIAAQTFRDVEIMVVDSGSTDRTLEIARQYADIVVEIPAEDFTFGYASNVGCRHASGQYAVLISAHAVPIDENWLDHLLKPFCDDDVAGTWGSEQGWSDSPETLPESLSKRICLTQVNFGPRNGVWGFNAANAAIRLDRWREVPFDERLSASEDKLWAWSQVKNGHRLVYVPEAAAYHIHRLSPRQVYRRAWGEHRATAEFMPELEFGLMDVARGILRRPRRGLWQDARVETRQPKGSIRYAGYLWYRLMCRVMYHWGLYRGLRAGRNEHARRAAERVEGSI
ncbi:MAG: glycosyltransferase [Chloroflexi bacterium]|nr:glycosyltransferase [Chloroflexota bacterium]